MTLTSELQKSHNCYSNTSCLNSSRNFGAMHCVTAAASQTAVVQAGRIIVTFLTVRINSDMSHLAQ